MTRRLLWLWSIFATVGVCAQSTDSAQRYDHDAIKNLYSLEFVYSSPTSASIKYVEQTTILNRSGEKKGDFTCYVSPTITLSNFSGTISDAQGKVIRKLRRADLKYTEISESLADDAAFYYLECHSAVYPYTVRIEYELTMKNGILCFPSFMPLTTIGTQLEKGVYTLSVPQGLQFGYKCRNISEPNLSTMVNRDIYTWTIENTPAIRIERASPPLLELVPQVVAIPYDFQYEGTKGSLRNWGSYGIWQCSLNADRGQLPEALRAEVHQRTDTLQSPRDKIRALCDYLGNTTRYVSIQLGIGGQQPMKAEDVYKTKFGDCKALTNYLKAMLSECGIDSDYAMVHTQRRRMYPDFASPMQANHVILRVPQPNDTLWLECTNPEIPFGYVHKNIAGHDAIVFGDNKGTMVTLPQYADTLNRMVRQVEVRIAEDGSAEGHITERYEANCYESIMYFTKIDNKERTNHLLSDLKIPIIKVINVAVDEKKRAIPSIEISYDFASPSYGTMTGNRYFLPQNPFSNRSLVHDKERLYDIYHETGFLDKTSIRIELPDNLSIEAMPKPCRIETPFGWFLLQIVYLDRKLCIEQHLCIYSGTHSRTLFEQYRTFINECEAAFNARIVLRKE